MSTIPEQIAECGRLLFERRLTDMAGGNISVRDGDTIYITPRYSGARHHWQLEPTDILHGGIDGGELLRHPRFSREGKMHLAVYRAFDDAKAIIHAHPFHVLPFCAARRPIEPVLEGTQKFGIVEVATDAPAHSDKLADSIVAQLRGKEIAIRTQAAGVLVPLHGIVVVGKDLLATIDALERIDWNAWCILAQGLLRLSPPERP